MKVIRQTVIDTDDFQIGDVMEFALKSGEKVEAMAVDKAGDKTVFCLVDCQKDEYPMNETNTTNGGWCGSKLRKTLNDVIVYQFPDEIREKMKPFDNGDLLRVPSMMEIFGETYFGVEPTEGVKQWELMKERRNRIAWQGSKTNQYEWYWLRDVVSSTAFARVHSYGLAAYAGASASFGIRPAFQI